MHKLWLSLLFATSVVATAQSSPPQPPPDVQFQDYKRQLLGFFEPLHLIPILSPAGEQVGHIYDARTLTLLASASECFPHLAAPTRTELTLPELHFGPDLKSNLELGVPALVNFEVGGKRLTATNISFHDAYLLQVSQVALQNAFVPKKCGQFKSIVDGRYVPEPASQLPLIIGAVYYARREIELVTDSDVNADIAASKLGALIKKLSLKLTASASVSASQKSVVRVTSVTPEAIAVRPAFIPTIYKSLTLGDGKAPPNIQGATWEPFDPDRPSQQSTLSQLLNSVICTDVRCFTRQ